MFFKRKIHVHEVFNVSIFKRYFPTLFQCGLVF